MSSGCESFTFGCLQTGSVDVLLTSLVEEKKNLNSRMMSRVENEKKRDLKEPLVSPAV